MSVQSERNYLDRIQGSLIGGAVGDALGYPVEFMTYWSIQETFGPEGIRSYWLSKTGGTALFSDDTQMTLFTADGLLAWAKDVELRGTEKAERPVEYIYRSYLDWLHTQDRSYRQNPCVSRLLEVDGLYSRRAPGGTCLSALYSGEMGTIEHALNDSKGCGGVMRVAPVGLVSPKLEDGDAVMQAAEAAAITHSHPMGYISAGALAYIVSECTYGDGQSLAEIVDACGKKLRGYFPGNERYAEEMGEQLAYAARLAANGKKDIDNIMLLGEGWVGDEALAIAAYCCLRYPDSFDEAVITAVNHSGDSDSTGAIAGNIMGAYLGLSAIGTQWTKDLELRDLLLEVAQDLCQASASR